MNWKNIRKNRLLVKNLELSYDFLMTGQRGHEPNNNINYLIDYYINTSINGARGQNRTGTRINLNGF
jgi:hypothetical protein